MKIIQLGCNDGNDDVYDLLSKINIDFALLIDANPHVIDVAKNKYKNIKNVIIESWLISDKNEELSFYIPHFNRHNTSAHSSIYLEHVLKHGHNLEEVKELKIKSLNINELFAKYDIKELDYLFVDCEYEDYNIINSIDFSKIKIDKIKFEYGHIQNDLFRDLKSKLVSIGYKILKEEDGNIFLSMSESDFFVVFEIVETNSNNYVDIVKNTLNSNKKFYTTSFNKSNNSNISDGWSYHNLIEYGGFKHFSEKTENIKNADFVIYIRNYETNFVFDISLAEQIIAYNKPIIIFDYSEYGSPCIFTNKYLYEYDFLGYKTEGEFLRQLENNYKSEAKLLLDYFYRFSEKNLIFCYFKRELSKFLDFTNCPFPIYPCDFINYAYEFNNNDDISRFQEKNIDLFYSWGQSSIDRAILHGNILSNIERFGNDIIMSEKHLEKCIEDQIKNFIVLYKSQWPERLDYKKYIPYSKTMIDLYGAGMKCFRNLESAIDSVSFKQDPSVLIHSYEWIDGKNCIYLPNKENNRLNQELSVEIIYDYLRINQGKLYNIYKESKNTAKMYINENYSKDYIYPKIQKLLK